jgi:hypothetical protein
LTNKTKLYFNESGNGLNYAPPCVVVVFSTDVEKGDLSISTAGELFFCWGGWRRDMYWRERKRRNGESELTFLDIGEERYQFPTLHLQIVPIPI